MNLSQENLRAIMFYNWKRGLNSEKMAAEMCETLGSNVVTSRTCRNWITKFESGIQTVIQDWINVKPREFFRKAFTDLPERWKKIIDNNGNYFV